MKNANPQGKGLVPVMDQWSAARPLAVPKKAGGQLLADYFTSLLVLSSRFGFKPVTGNTYYLYLKGTEWVLSLIAPEEWGQNPERIFFAACCLCDDMTWVLTPEAEALENERIQQALALFYQGFTEHMDCSEALEDILPFYQANLPFYARLYASALASSIQQSLHKSGFEDVSARLLMQELPQRKLLSR